MSLRGRFLKREVLLEALLSQRIVRGDLAVATALAEQGELIEFAPGEVIIEQGKYDQSIYFILAGKAQVIVNGMRLFHREAGLSVGEMSAINPQLARSATIEAAEPLLAWKIGGERLEVIGEATPSMWRLLAVDLASRVEQRNELINRANQKPVVFIICSAEALPVARALRVGLSHTADVDIWSDEQIFAAGSYPLEALETRVAQSDFGLAIAQPDDLVSSRNKQAAVPRDNVIFELGFFMSRLGRHRTLLLVPVDDQVKLPSDFKGLTPIPYRSDVDDMPRAIGAALDQVIGIITRIGVRASLVEPK